MLQGAKREKSAGDGVGAGVGVEASIRDMTSGKEVSRGEFGEVCMRGPNVMKGYWAGENVKKEAFSERGLGMH